MMHPVNEICVKIQSGDVVLEIPSRLMMTPVDAFSDPLIGSILMMHRDLLRGETRN